MKAASSKSKTVDEYIDASKPDVQDILRKIRTIIRTTSPEAIESIAYDMPAYKLNKKPLIYFAAFDHHIGLYATPEAHEEFSEQLARYKQGKGSVQFPLGQPIPYDLIEKMVAYKTRQLNL